MRSTSQQNVAPSESIIVKSLKQKLKRKAREMINYICPICGNSNPVYLGFKNGEPYCRKCILFRGQEATGDFVQIDTAEYTLRYELSNDQKKLSNQLIENFKNNKDSLVCAVCGSGKTEICLGIISYCIKNHFRVGFAVPRRDVCVELYYRFTDIFRENELTAVYGGNTSYLEGDLVVLTTHQLFRYEKYFDLLIVDEIDAFPFKGSEILEIFLKRSVRKNLIMMSATPSKETIEFFSKPNRSILELYSRFHGKPLPVPRIIKGNALFLNYKLIRETSRLLKKFKQIFIFVPTIDLSIKIYRLLNMFFPSGGYINSRCENRDEIIKRFRVKKYRYLVTTAVLERGVTVKDLQVIVYRSDHPIYDSHALIQIAGRVGRKKEAPEGEVIFLARENNKEMQRAVAEIHAANKKLFDMLQKDQNK